MTTYFARRIGATAIIALVCVSSIGCGKAPTAGSAQSGAGATPAVNGSAADETPAIDLSKPSVPLLLSAKELQELIQFHRKASLSFQRILDARSKENYDMGHIPGAFHVNVDDWKKQALAKGGLQNADAWSKKLGDMSITRWSQVVVYSDKPADAARIWWTIKYLGVRDVSLLDGGWDHWLKEGGAMSNDPPQLKPQYAPVQFQKQRLADIEDLKTSYQSKTVSVVDARSQSEYDSGRIPGAVRLEWSDLLTDDGRFKPRDEMRKLFADRGIVEGKTAITYCQSGGRASLDAFALELAGF
ncbi:MAG: rhodanese-like domain-containing protein, partial [Planctomycetaceae bacterium]